MNKKMNVLDNFNERYEEKFENYEDLMQYLNDLFEKEIEKTNDVQEAYDIMDSDFDGFIGDNFAFQSADGPWYISYSDQDLKEEDIELILERIKERYGRKDISNLDDATSFLEHQTAKDMSNAGVDPKNALKSILEELFEENNLFYVEGFNGSFELVLG